MTNRLFWVFAGLFLLAALHHAYEVFDSSLRPDYPIERHVVFVLINLVLAFFMIKRTRYLVPVLLLIAIQQVYSHGDSMLKSYSQGVVLSYTDWTVVILIPIIFIVYARDVLGKTESDG